MLPPEANVIAIAFTAQFANQAVNCVSQLHIRELRLVLWCSVVIYSFVI